MQSPSLDTPILPNYWRSWSEATKRAYLAGLQEKLTQLTGRPAKEVLAEQRQDKDASKKRIQAFLDRYYTRPDLFLIEAVNWPEGKDAYDYQVEGAQELIAHNRHAFRGPRGTGKTTLSALLILWFSLTRSLAETGWKCISTANYWRQLQKFLWPEIHKWAYRLKWQTVIPRAPFKPNQELMILSLRLPFGEAFALASDDNESMEGAQADEIFYVFDESKIIPPESWDSVEGAQSRGKALWFACSIPGDIEGRFYDICRGAPGFQDWSRQHVTKEQVIAAGQMSEQWAADRLLQWGENSTLYQNHVLGNFSETSADSLIPLAWIEAAQERWYLLREEWRASPIVQFGVDVGRGGDKSVIAPRTKSYAITKLERNQIADTMHTAGLVSGHLNGAAQASAMIDLPGVGSGVFDSVKRDHPKRTTAFVPSATTDFRDRTGEFGFPNKRQAALWNMREILDPQYEVNACLPPDDTLAGDLTAFRYRYVPGAKIQVESKRKSFEEHEQSIVQRLGHSTDDGDAVVMACWEEKTELPAQTGELQGW